MRWTITWRQSLFSLRLPTVIGSPTIGAGFPEKNKVRLLGVAMVAGDWPGTPETVEWTLIVELINKINIELEIINICAYN